MPANSVGPTARVVIKPRKALPFFSRHPWVFQGAIDRIDGTASPGDAVAVQAQDGQFIAWGLFNPASKIGVRLYSWDEATPLTDQFWRQRIEDAVGMRKVLFPQQGPTDACRQVYSEADGLSGLTVDRYGKWLLVQLTSLALRAAERNSARQSARNVAARGDLVEDGKRDPSGGRTGTCGRTAVGTIASSSPVHRRTWRPLRD